MKKLLLLLSWITIPTLLFGQFHMGLGYGYDFGNSKAISTWSLGFAKKGINLDAEVRPSLTRAALSHAYCGAKASVDVYNDEYFAISTGAGYFYDYRSADKVQYNGFKAGYFGKGILYLKDNAGVYFESMYISKGVQSVFGIHYIF